MVIVVKRYMFNATLESGGTFTAVTDTVAIQPPAPVPGSTWIQWGQPAFDERGATVGWWLREDEPELCGKVRPPGGDWVVPIRCTLPKGHEPDVQHSALGVVW